jgi:hypothetical protein
VPKVWALLRGFQVIGCTGVQGRKHTFGWSPERLTHQYNVVYQKTYLTLFGVRVYFYEVVKNRWGKAGRLIAWHSDEAESIRRHSALVIEEVES